MKTMKSIEQRKVYASRRMSQSIDRVITGRTPEAKARGKRWAEAWARVAGIAKPA
jgi:hypothetical protein